MQVFNNANIKFTKDQKQAVDGILSFIKADYNEYQSVIGLTGAGGVGKTFITKYIIENCGISPSAIKCASPTHKACRVFGNAIDTDKVETIQSVLGLRLNLALENFDPDRPQFDPKGEIKLESVRLLIVDEASMLPYKLVTFIIKLCVERRIKVLFIGDSSQLNPVGETKSAAFTKCTKIYNLTTVVRQEANNPLSKLLNILRDDITYKSNNFLRFVTSNGGLEEFDEYGQGFAILDKERFEQEIINSFNRGDYRENIDMFRIICYTNRAVSIWNNFVRNKIIPNYDKEVITKNDLIMSYVTIVDEFMCNILQNSEEYIVHNIANYVDPTYDFKGYLVKLQKVNGGQITRPLFIIDHKDPFTLQRYYKIHNELKEAGLTATGATRTSMWKQYFKFHNENLLLVNINDRNNGKTIVDRDLDYGFAISSHKSQGSTYDVVFVDVKDMVYDKNGNVYGNRMEMLRRLYVACSRPKRKVFLLV